MLNNDKSNADDIIQNVFLKLLKAPEKFDTDKLFKSWRFTVVSNECRKTFRIKALENINETSLNIPFESYNNQEE